MGRTIAGLCLLAGIALAGCSSGGDKPEDPNAFPKEYQRELLMTLTNLMEDPTNVREAGISDPVLRPAGSEQRYTVCVRSNSRNLNRHYEGVKERIAYFYGGTLNQIVEASKGQCAGAVYKPWPELEKYCMAKSCT